MNGEGRILVRPSGTESLVRVMVEADSDALVTQTIDAIILRIKQAAG
jgi:phosphoglucosamine mutase